jgi:hypothetical protein
MCNIAAEVSKKIASFDEVSDAASATGEELRNMGYYYPSPDSGIHFSHPRREGTMSDYIGRLAQLWQGDIGGLPNSPGALNSILTLAPAGAALGLATGYLGDKASGGLIFHRKRLAPALMGAALGSLPGLGMMGLNALQGKDILHDSPFNVQPDSKVPEMGLVKALLSKHSAFQSASPFPTVVPVDHFKDMIYGDPDVAGRLHPREQAAAVGLIEGAQNLPGRKSGLPLVTASDVGRMAVGLGSGYASGLFVGRVLGGLFGVSDEAQRVLRQSGAAAGLIKSVIPIAYGYQ